MGKKIKVATVQINNSFYNQCYFPYSVGIIQAFSRKYLEEADDFEFLLPIYSRVSLEDALGQIHGADIACFSVYAWNIGLSLKIAQEFKKVNPKALIVFGGPQIPNRETESFLLKNRFIDIACHDEGENIFLGILKNYRSRDWRGVQSISFIDDSGAFAKTGACERINDLSAVPSPYLDGVFDSLIKKEKKIEWVALWETNRGCPFLCSYCDWGSATKNRVYEFDIERLFKEIDWFSNNQIEFVFCCDANFGILKRDMEIVEHFARNKERFGYPKAFSIQSTKSFTPDTYKIFKTLSDSGLNKGISLSLQSMNKDTLRDTRRKNISVDGFREVQKVLASYNIATFTDIILGLPNETYQSFSEGVSEIIENGQHNRIQFNNLSILPNAEMGDPEYQKRFGFDIVNTRIINIHGSLTDANEVSEIQKLVVGTNTMPKEEWVRVRVFGWMTSLLHFNKLLQLPFVILSKAYGVSFGELIELFTEAKDLTPAFSYIRSFFINKAADIQNGGAEFCESKKWLNIWWPADELIFIELCAENKLSEFYNEAERIIAPYLRKRNFSGFEGLLHESIVLNKELIKLPFQEKDLDVVFNYNIWEVYRSALIGADTPLKKSVFRYHIDRTSVKWPSWGDWCKEVVWYGNKKGAYIYNCSALSTKPAIAGEKELCR